jgi:hypothetical protein
MNHVKSIFNLLSEHIVMYKKIALIALFTITSLVNAAPQRFNFLFAEDGGSAQAEGYIVLEMTLISNPGNSGAPIPSPSILDLYVEVTGSSGGDGIFTLNDFRAFAFGTGSLALDFSRELVGQPTGNGTWGTIIGALKETYGIDGIGPGGGGDFNLFTPRPVNKTSSDNNSVTLGENLPPFGVAPYVLQAASGEEMAIVSFGPNAISVPMLSTLSYLLIALSILALGLFTFKNNKI